MSLYFVYAAQTKQFKIAPKLPSHLVEEEDSV